MLPFFNIENRTKQNIAIGTVIIHGGEIKSISSSLYYRKHSYVERMIKEGRLALAGQSEKKEPLEPKTKGFAPVQPTIKGYVLVEKLNKDS